MATPVLRSHAEIDAAFGHPPPFREPTRWPSRRPVAGAPFYLTDAPASSGACSTSRAGAT
jgi:hypothetical protein